MAETDQSLGQDVQRYLQSYLQYKAVSVWVDFLLVPVLVILFTVSVASIVLTVIAAGFPDVMPPCMLYLTIGASCTSVILTYVWAYVKPPALLRYLELFLWLMAARHLGLQQHPEFWQLGFLQSFGKHEIFVPAIVLGLFWWLGASLATDFIYLNPPGTSMLVPLALTASYEESREHRRFRITRHVLAQSRIVHRLIRGGLVAGSVVGAALEFELVPRDVVGWTVAGLSFVLVLSLWGLLSAAHLLRLRNVWAESGIPMSPSVPSVWIAGIFFITTCFATFGILLPAGISPLSFNQVMQVLFFWITPVRRFVEGQFVGSGSESHTESSRAGGIQQSGIGIGIVTYAVLWVIAALFALSVSIAVLGFIIWVVSGRNLKRLPVLLRLPVLFYLLVVRWTRVVAAALWRALCQWWNDARYMTSLLGGRLARYVERRREQDAAQDAIGEQERQTIRRLYRHFLAEARRRGLPRRRSETAWEYAKRLSLFTEDTQILGDFTAVYNETRYGERRFRQEMVARVSEWVRHLLAGLGRRGRGEEQSEE